MPVDHLRFLFEKCLTRFFTMFFSALFYTVRGYIYIYMYVCKRYVCIYVFMYVCITYVYVYTHTYTYIHSGCSSMVCNYKVHGEKQMHVFISVLGNFLGRDSWKLNYKPGAFLQLLTYLLPYFFPKRLCLLLLKALCKHKLCINFKTFANLKGGNDLSCARLCLLISFIPQNDPMMKALFLKILLILLAEFFGTLLNFASEVSVSLTCPRPSSDSLHFANEETRGEK